MSLMLNKSQSNYVKNENSNHEGLAYEKKDSFSLSLRRQFYINIIVSQYQSPLQMDSTWRAIFCPGQLQKLLSAQFDNHWINQAIMSALYAKSANYEDKLMLKNTLDQLSHDELVAYSRILTLNSAETKQFISSCLYKIIAEDIRRSIVVKNRNKFLRDMDKNILHAILEQDKLPEQFVKGFYRLLGNADQILNSEESFLKACNKLFQSWVSAWPVILRPFLMCRYTNDNETTHIIEKKSVTSHQVNNKFRQIIIQEFIKNESFNQFFLSVIK